MRSHFECEIWDRCTRYNCISTNQITQIILCLKLWNVNFLSNPREKLEWKLSVSQETYFKMATSYKHYPEGGNTYWGAILQNFIKSTTFFRHPFDAHNVKMTLNCWYLKIYCRFLSFYTFLLCTSQLNTRHVFSMSLIKNVTIWSTRLWKPLDFLKTL